MPTVLVQRGGGRVERAESVDPRWLGADAPDADPAEVQALMTQRSTLQQEDLRRMVAIYEAMKPRDAARIFNELETDIIVDLLDRLPERRSAPIIAEMTDAKAREVTRIMLQRRALPGDRAKPPGALPAPPPMTPS